MGSQKLHETKIFGVDPKRAFRVDETTDWDQKKEAKMGLRRYGGDTAAETAEMLRPPRPINGRDGRDAQATETGPNLRKT